jgi:hypothetical protein
MSFLVSEAASEALKLAGFVEGGMQRGFLDDAPDWWVASIRQRLRTIDALTCGERADLRVAEGLGR